LIVDNFAGGGGASTGIELALGRPVDIAINHDPEAVAMHRMNHPRTRHYCESVWEIDPRAVTEGRPVGLVWLSPDCKHFSKAKGGTPVEKKIRGLAWVALRWAATVRPRVIMLENVEEFTTWGPLIKGPDGKMRPDPAQKGREFQVFVNALRRQGYMVEWRELRACDYGAPTIRKRLFLIARRDGLPIVWPAPTYGDPRAPGFNSRHLTPWRTAAECIDWTIPCPSIFERTKPLASATCRRIAKGIMRYVINAAEPFIVDLAHGETSPGGVKRWGKGFRGIDLPLSTVTASGNSALVVPTICGVGGRAGQSRPRGLDEPMATITNKGDTALVAAFLAKHYTGVVGAPLTDPMPTVTAVDHNSLIISNLIKLRGTNIGQSVTDPLHTISAQGTHHAQVCAFLTSYYGNGGDSGMGDPLHTVTSHDRFGLVIVQSQQYAIVDIGLRMLAPHELYRAQGFPGDYIIDCGDFAGEIRPLTKTAQVRMCGNSVCPPLAAALVRANVPDMAIPRRAA
jgi:DNA (cytosine-5)-methyltransferase 1